MQALLDAQDELRRAAVAGNAANAPSAAALARCEAALARAVQAGPPVGADKAVAQEILASLLAILRATNPSLSDPGSRPPSPFSIPELTHFAHAMVHCARIAGYSAKEHNNGVELVARHMTSSLRGSQAYDAAANTLVDWVFDHWRRPPEEIADMMATRADRAHLQFLLNGAARRSDPRLGRHNAQEREAILDGITDALSDAAGAPPA
jgi:hypothetical protein